MSDMFNDLIGASLGDAARIASSSHPISGSRISAPARSRCGCCDHLEWDAVERCGGVLSGQ
jgi:hypothetical protein